MTYPTSTSGLLTVANNLPAGTYYETITVTDSIGASTLYPLTVIVNPVLTLTGNPSTSFTTTIGKATSLQISVAYGTDTKTITIAAPKSGITLDTTTLGSGYVTIKVDTSVPANTYSITVFGKDASGYSTSLVVTLTVNKWPVIASPAIVTGALKVNLDPATYSTGSTWSDTSGNGFNATLGGGLSTTPAGTAPTLLGDSGGIFSFNETTGATTNYAQILNPGSLDTLTVSVWAKFPTIQSSSSLLQPCLICEVYTAAGNKINYAIHFSGNGIIAQYYTGTTWSDPTSTFYPQVNTWYQFTYVVSKSGSTYKEDLFVNGVRVGNRLHNT